jgi:hypothetical protein
MAQKTSKGQEGYYSRYKANKTWEVNRMRRLERTLKAQPENLQVKAALKGGLVYRRKTPSTRPWSASWIRTAKLFKLFAGRFDPAIMSANQDVSRAAMQKPGPRTLEKLNTPTMADKSFFSIGSRIYKGSAQ